MKSNKANISIETIIFIVLGLLVLGIIVYLIWDQSGNVSKLTACQVNSGDLIEEECNAEVATTFLPGNTDEGNCCKKKPLVTIREYETWLNTTTPIFIEGEVGRNEVPVRTSGTIENILLEDPSKVPEGSSFLAFNGKENSGQTSPFIAVNGKVLVTATHNVKKGAYCHLYIAEAEQVSGGWSAKKTNGAVVPYGSLSYKNTNCAPTENALVQLQIDSAIANPGFYKADYLVKESATGTTLASKSIVFEVTGMTSDSEAEAKGTAPTITILNSQKSRDQKIYCFVTVNVNTWGRALEEPSILSAKTTQSCTVASYTSHNFNSGTTQLSPNEDFCIKVEQDYTDVNGVPRTKLEIQNFEQTACDFVQVFNGNRESLGCTETCEDYQDSKSNLCLDYTRRSAGCQFSVDCYEKGNTCQSCSSAITSCASYKNEDSCEANQCLPEERCEWNRQLFGLLPGKCAPLTT